MGKIHPDLAGAYTRSVGNTVYYMRHGENLVRRKGVQAENRKYTEGQLVWQERFGVLRRLAMQTQGVSQLGFPGKPRKLTAAHAWMGVNSRAFREVEEGGEQLTAVDYGKLVFSQGGLFVPQVSARWMDKDGSMLQVDNLGAEVECAPSAHADDVVMGVMLDAKNMFCLAEELFKRGETKEGEWAVPAFFDREQLYLYCFALTKDGKRASRTVFLTPEAAEA